MADKLRQAIALIESGDKGGGRQILADVLKADPQNETAWLWMSSVVTNDAERRYCLKQALAINPNSLPAKRGLTRLQQGGQSQPVEVPEESALTLAEFRPEAEESSSPITEPTTTTNKPQTASLVLKLVMIICFGLLVCGVGGAIGYWVLTSVLRSTEQAAQPTVAKALPTRVASVEPVLAEDTATPTKVQAATPSRTKPTATPTLVLASVPSSGGPTATPPGEDIVDPNYLQGKVAYEANRGIN